MITDQEIYAPPAGRSTPQEVERLSQILRSNNLLHQLLDAMPDFVMILNGYRQIVFSNKVTNDFASRRGLRDFHGMRPGEFFSCETARCAPGGCGTGEKCSTCGAGKSIYTALKGKIATDECRLSQIGPLGLENLDYLVKATPFEWDGEKLVLFVVSDNGDAKRRKVLEHIFFHDVLNTAGTINGLAALVMSDQVPIDMVKKDLFLASEILINEIRSQRMLVMAENNELVVQMQPLGAGDVVSGVVRAFRNHDVATGKHLVGSVEGDDFIFESDLALLTRTLGNLIKNGLEASNPGQTVTVSVKCTADEVCFSCHNPKVMPRSVQLQMFQRSFSTKGVGRGIGTYSVKLLTEKYLNGRVGFVSNVERGTVFFVTLGRQTPIIAKAP